MFFISIFAPLKTGKREMADLLYYFNPDHDMAMANFTPYYKAPAEIVRMAADLSVLPAWYADRGAAVKVDALARVREWENPLFPTDVEWTDRWLPVSCSPWGWNPALVHALQGIVPPHLLPDEARLSRLRYLAGRQRCPEVLRFFADCPFTCGEAEVCASVAEVRAFIESRGEVLLKAPWSGSGRGLVHVSPATWNASVEGWTARIIRTQGAVMAEPYYDKMSDFAMEFRADGSGGVTFVGYSLFETDSFGNYKANLLLSNEEIERRLASFAPVEWLHVVRNRLLEVFPPLFGKDYAGYFGVDMMICCRAETYALHPCVEINLRMNMGVVARLLADRYVASGSQGCYVTEHYRADGEALDFHCRMCREFPAVVSDGRLVSGYLSLTPVWQDTRFQAYMLI